METIDRLVRLFIGRDDAWSGIGEDEDSGCVFKDSGFSGVVCTGYAFAIRRILGSDRVVIRGFLDSGNPGTEVGRLAGGHDFAVVDDRFIVDPWLPGVELTGDRGVYDLLDPGDLGDLGEILRLYGDREKWSFTVV
jgi:hypothetical protein